MILLHGTTRNRAERIIREGPNPWYVEPHSQAPEGKFYACTDAGPFHFGSPHEYARRKAAAFPDEGGPVILEMEVPENVVALAIDEEWFPLRQGLVVFEEGKGLEELLAAWPTLPKRIAELPDE
jgi:hypothetical protein